MATPTYTALATFTASGGESSVTFSSIPATYRDLIFVIDVALSGTNSVFMTFNNDTGANYTLVTMEQALAFSPASGSYTRNQIDVNTLFPYDGHKAIVQIMDYSATDKHKSVLQRYQRGDTGAHSAAAARWANTAAINEIDVSASAGTYSSGTISLYGIEA